MANPVKELESGAILAFYLVAFVLLGGALYKIWKLYKAGGDPDSDLIDPIVGFFHDLFGGEEKTWDGSEYTPEQTARMTALADNWTPPAQIDVYTALEAANNDLNSPKSTVIDWAYDNRLF